MLTLISVRETEILSHSGFKDVRKWAIRGIFKIKGQDLNHFKFKVENTIKVSLEKKSFYQETHWLSHSLY
jgi:hypothetical protein